MAKLVSQGNPFFYLFIILMYILPDYVWIHPETGEIRCWLNNLPDGWTPAGNNNSVIGSGAGPSDVVYLAVCIPWPQI